MKIFFTIAISSCLLFASAGVGLAYVAESTSYKIESDSINFGGTENSTSASFNLSDTFGELATGTSTSASFNLHAGYRALESESASVVVVLTLSAPDDVPLGNLDKGEEISGQAVWNVSTNNPAGYRLSVKSNTEPALKSTEDSFTDYSPTDGVSTPAYSWSLGASSALFGFTPEGTDVVARFKDNGSTCATGSGNTTSSCWAGFSTTNQTIAEKTSANALGTDTTVRLQAGIGNDSETEPGDYTANIIATAITL
ncbi:MAG: hypothetical protein A2571_03735 [Candidatus Vogelbacteria bacterium RIFOXYD1_FULL_44_32]|uniref:WxL domain-containing protein n=1 Tax=Candidatus Vogelbacteria bacterium RIFOXYD1_FULL_44_32 TaxID=1802438 RepID=A0A1G2QDS0_9BACT|nr:MAG: hypothetical protein A2571_03735 [Candidatus Vogelbacteria bacterium RIFOXYD1_FULL_44_32]